ncbi:MAG: Nif3-like dinuclear metal center hexameric protein [Thermodesulfobacteriota bacterium]|nr:Nif3-like dinuclear metal center hexameric protein [Thermodesulfobacteriota bacterium]
MSATVADIIQAMETIAPGGLAEKWDNVGLQVGRKSWPVKKVWVSLDPALEVVANACQNDADLLITHHPLIFKPLRSVDFATPTGAIIRMAAERKMAIFSAHTNLDIVAEGLNDALAELVGLKRTNVLCQAVKEEKIKLVIYVPEEYEKKILDVIFQTKAGKIGEYSACTFRNRGEGTFRPGSMATPFIGSPGEISAANEIRIETVVQKDDLSDVIESVRSHHPYETMAYDVYPLLALKGRNGIGRVGEFDEDIELKTLALRIKEKLRLKYVKISGDHQLPVKSAAICTGSGSDMMKYFLSSGAQVYISGDLKYHDARDAQAANLGIIDIGHYASEYLMIDMVVKRLQKKLSKAGLNIEVKPCRLENDPFTLV